MKNSVRSQSYSTVRRYMVAQGMVRKPRLKPKARPGELLAAERRERREIRSYEAEYVGSLWHLDFHHGSLKVVTSRGQWERPLALGILDDHSRLCCHLQWYLSETTEDLVHGLSQAIQKRGLPRALMTDNGSAMLADEFTEGLLRLGILHEKTLPYSAYQNGKQECFWANLEGRLMEMLGNLPELTLDFLNQATQAWVEIEYNRALHREIGCSPVTRFARAPDVLRPSPSSDALRAAFRMEAKRRQRQSDGTISLGRRAFRNPGTLSSLPGRGGAIPSLGPQSGRLGGPPRGNGLGPSLSAGPHRQRRRSARGHRSAPDEVSATDPSRSPAELPPLLKQILAEYSATGLPPAYLPKNPSNKKEKERRRPMSAKKLLALWGLKWNPFTPELPGDALLVTAKIESFAWRVEQLVQEGGFALIFGESGTGKSVALRIVAQRLSALRDVVVGAWSGPSPRAPTSIVNWEISSRSSSARRIGGVAFALCGNVGRLMWLPRASSRYC